MKRWILLLLALVMLTGCGGESPTEPSDLTDPSAASESTEPELPSLLLEEVDGISTYSLGTDCCAGLLPWGEGKYALFTTGGYLYLLSGEELSVEKIRDLECRLSPDDPSLLVSGEKLCYFDSNRDAYVTLGKHLTELSAITIRDDVVAGPVMNSDMTTIYYCTADGVRAMDMSTGTSRLLRQEHQTIASLDGLLFEEINLHYTRILDNGVVQDCFIRSTDGTLVETATLNGPIVTWGRNYAAVMEFDLPISTYREILCGSLDGSPQLLPTQEEYESILFPGKGTVLLQNETNPGLTLELLDLETGNRLAHKTHTDWDTAFSSASFDGKNLWLWSADRSSFCRWDVSGCTVEEGTLEKLYTLSDPAPLDEAKAIAQTIADNLGVGFGLVSANNRTTGVNYDSWPDYRPQEYAAALAALKLEMETFPEGFFPRLDLTIHLIDAFDPAQSITPGTGELVIGERRIMELAISEDMMPVFYHELFHAMELFITGESKLLSDWSELNPEGFEYTGSYTEYYEGKLAASPYLDAVADEYGLISPREDRAQVFMYAMMADQAARFESDVMQQKLSTLCAAIRDAWGWKNSTAVLPWEQYLKTQ